MRFLLRYLKLYGSFVSNSLSRAMEFRAQFLFGIAAYLISPRRLGFSKEGIFRHYGELDGE